MKFKVVVSKGMDFGYVVEVPSLPGVSRRVTQSTRHWQISRKRSHCILRICQGMK